MKPARSSLLSVLSLSLFSLFGCTQQTAAPQPANAIEESSARGVVIAVVETNDARVSILGGGKELRVIVKKGGAIVADGVTLGELRDKDPALHQIVTSSYASTGGTYLDATLTRAPSRGGFVDATFTP